MDNAKVCVIGSINMDLTVNTDRVPAQGETVIGNSFAEYPGGKGANQAVAAARLGAEVHLVGAVGADSFGDTLFEHLRSENVHTAGVEKLVGEATGIANIIVSENDNRIIVASGANALVTPALVDAERDVLTSSDVLLLQLEIPMETVVYVLKLATEHHIPVVINPAPYQMLPEEVYETCTYITPNEIELAEMEGDRPVYSFKEKLIITQGHAGVSYYADDQLLNVPAFSVDAKDTTGAGDTFNGAFATEIARGTNLKEAIRFANAAAAISVTKVGAQSGMPTREEVEIFLKEQK